MLNEYKMYIIQKRMINVCHICILTSRYEPLLELPLFLDLLILTAIALKPSASLEQNELVCA